MEGATSMVSFELFADGFVEVFEFFVMIMLGNDVITENVRRVGSGDIIQAQSDQFSVVVGVVGLEDGLLVLRDTDQIFQGLWRALACSGGRGVQEARTDGATSGGRGRSSC